MKANGLTFRYLGFQSLSHGGRELRFSVSYWSNEKQTISDGARHIKSQLLFQSAYGPVTVGESPIFTMLN